MFENNKCDARVPTCIISFDKILKGGFVPGSTVLLLSELGCGEREFMQTSIENHFPAFKNRDENGLRELPSKVYYISHKPNFANFSNTRDDDFQDYVVRIDLSERMYDAISNGSQGYDMLSELISHLEKILPGSLVFVDSLTPYATCCKKDDVARNLVSFVYKMSKTAKQKNITFVSSIAKNLLTTSGEIEISDAFDAVFVFERQKGENIATRQRRMYIEKYDDVLSGLGDENSVVYNVSISEEHGFEISNLRRVS